MPEGDTIHRAAAVLRSALVGRPLTRVDLPRLPRPWPAVGAEITGVEARGKHLLIATSDGLIVHTHQMMTGSWHLYAPGERWRKSPRAARVVLAVHGTVAVCFASPVVEVLDASGLARHRALRQLGPDLCDPGADIDEAVARLERLSTTDRTIGETLLDQRIACGVGNVYRCDVLFLHGIHPATPVGDVPAGERRALLSTAADLLRRNLGPASSRTTVAGGPDGSLWVYGRGGHPCRRCRTPVSSGHLGEQARLVYWCPTCQPAAAPGTAPVAAADPDTGIDARGG
ncbi:MAG: DNA-formamidopyrimidine glycosylase family protein [Nitriliruptor sp.]|uniref:Fpg/Nei family DNA glycosylase n=1 Tax=Nitriliruptor sp. TaxID=2448056 RepID=UPI0034A0AB62